MSLKSLVNKYWPIAVVMLVGGALRLPSLLSNPISLFSDEIDMGYQAYSLLKTGCDYSGYCFPVQFHSFSDVQPPIPIYLIALSNLLGFSLEISIRLVPAIFGILGILVTYLLVENLKSKKIFNIDLPHLGIMSASILALVPWHLTYSRIGFSLAMLYFFVVFGFYLLTKSLITNKNGYLYWSFVVLGLTPMVYNTAKMAILLYPILILLIPGVLAIIRSDIKSKLAIIFLFVPFLLMLLAGGTASRFNYISIFTDPTASTTVDQQRLLDSGPTAAVGTKTALYSKLIHNKPLLFSQKLLNNFFGLISTDFLFVNGDPNLRHSPKDWGMFYKVLFIPLLLGVFYIFRFQDLKLVNFLFILSLVSLVTSAVTRDGGAHASRSFLFLLPLVVTTAIGLSYLLKLNRLVFSILVIIFILESVSFLHDYWFHYRYYSETSWSNGLKEVVVKAQKHGNLPVVISPKNEHPLIFYLFYNRFDPQKFQSYLRDNNLFNNLDGKYNLDGNQIGDTNLFIAVPIDYANRQGRSLPDAYYYLTKLETENSVILSASTVKSIVRLHSGTILYYELSY